MELYEQISREYEFGAGPVIGVARKLGVHRRMVREAVRNAVPAQCKKTERPPVKMSPSRVLIDAILEIGPEGTAQAAAYGDADLRADSCLSSGLHAWRSGRCGSMWNGASAESRMISGQTESVGARLLTEKQHLLPLATEPFDLAEVSYPRADQTAARTCGSTRTRFH